MVDYSAPGAWEEAKRISSLIGLAPNMIATCLRFLRRDVEERNGELSPVSRYCLASLLKSGNLRAALYYAALAYRPDRVTALRDFTWSSYFSLFSADELSYLIGILFTFRRVKRGCSPQEFSEFATTLHALADIGALVGDAIPRIGLGYGLLIGTMRHLGCAMLLGVDGKNFVKYQRALHLDGRMFDPELEMRFWRCTHAHVGSYIIQLLGLGVAEASTFVQAVLPSPRTESEPTPEVYRARITLTWIESFFHTGKAPEIVHRGEFYPRAVDLDRITSTIHHMRKEVGQSLWLTKNKIDLPPEVVARLETTDFAAEPRPAPQDLSAEEAAQIEQLAEEEE